MEHPTTAGSQAAPSPTTGEPPYDLFISYARNPDYRVARDLESFLESFHTVAGRGGTAALEPLRVCRDGGDFSLGARSRARAAADPASMEHVIRPHLERSAKLLVLCSASAAASPWVEAEIEWFVQSHGMDAVAVAVTEGDRPERTPERYFPRPLIAAGKHLSGWYDLRAARARGPHPYQDYDEARVQLAADLNDRSAGELFPAWERDQRRQERRRRILLTWTAVVVSAALVVATWQFLRAAAARDEVSSQLAESFAERAARMATPGAELDVVQALHLAVRAAMASPEGDARTPLHVARVLHVAAGLPVRIARLRDQQDELQHGVISPRQRYLLAITSQYEPAVWDLRTGSRMPVPFPRGSYVGESGDEAVGGPGEGMQFMEFSADGSAAKAVLNAELLWIWEASTGRLLDTVRLDYGDAPVFTRSGTAVVTLVSEPGGVPACPLVRCGRVLWQRPGSAPVSAEDTVPSVPDPRWSDTVPRTLLYRGGRPALVAVPGEGHYDAQLAQPEGEAWTALGSSPDDSLLTAVSRQGRVYVWDARARPLVREREDLNRLDPADVRLDPAGTGLVVLTAAGRLVHRRWDGTRPWSAPLARRSDTARIGWSVLWPANGPGLWVAAYRYGGSEWDPGWIELWQVGEPGPRRQGPFPGAPISDLVVFDSGEGGLMKVEGEEEYDNIERWAFAGTPDTAGDWRQVVIGNQLGGMTRDGRLMLRRSGQELRLLDMVTERPFTAPFRFAAGAGADRETAITLLAAARGVAETPTGVRGALSTGQVVQLHRQPLGARLEVDGRVVRAAESGRLAALSPDGELLAAARSYSSSGGRMRSGMDLVVRETETGRVLAAHYRLDDGRVLGFSPGSRSILTQGSDGRVREWFVHGGHRKAPDWLEDLGVALTATRLLPNLTLVDVGEEEHRQARARVLVRLRSAADRGDEGARFLLSHFFREPDPGAPGLGGSPSTALSSPPATAPPWWSAAVRRRRTICRRPRPA
ncbi:MAG TPA: TIR domain-containing protein [Longimicrobium sp.]|nr:TIR domain-containing protein [Longimicrobium sp.]